MPSDLSCFAIGLGASNGKCEPKQAVACALHAPHQPLQPLKTPPPPSNPPHLATPPHPQRQGADVLAAGERIGIAEVGILATVGAVTLPVHRHPLVAVLSTGDEVVEPSTADLGPGQIRDCNRSMLLAAAKAAGARVMDLGIAKDAEGHLEGAFARALEAGVDVLITSGGWLWGWVVWVGGVGWVGGWVVVLRGSCVRT